MTGGAEITPPGRSLTRVGWVGFVLIVVTALVRASVSFDPLPYWGSDPLVTFVPKTGFGPTAVAASDLLLVVGAMLCVLGGRGGRAGMLECVGLGGGAVGVGLHGLVLVRDPAAAGEWILHGSLDHLLPGVTWASGLAAMVGMRRACADPRARRMALGVLLGFVGMLAAKGLMQVYVEHPMTVHDYEQRRGETLAARGWRPGSAMAQAYERRLYQADASGWFGLSNVLATFAAAAAVGLGALAVSVLKKGLKWIAVLAGGGAALAALTLVLTHSKGGIGAAVVGLGWLIVVACTPIGRRWAGWLALAAAVGVVGLVAARGMLGDELGELSLRFRAQYQVGAVGAWLEHPVLGVGPGGFRDAYLRHRPELSVEEVVSPHSVVFEWITTLGVFGMVWVGLLAWAAFGLGCPRAKGIEPVATREDEPRRDLGVMVLFALAATAASAWVEREMATGEGGLMRVAGLAAWVVIASAVAAAYRAGPARLGELGVRAAGLVLVVHAMIEVTPGWESAAPVFGALLGAASARRAECAAPERRGGRAIGVLALAPIALLALAGVWRAGVWEGRLERAADAVRPAAEIRERFGQVTRGTPLPGDSINRVIADAADLLGEPIGGDTGNFNIQFYRLTARSGEAALAPLERGLRERPDHAGTRRALGRLHLALSSLSESMGNEVASRRHAERAARIADEGVALRPGSAAAWSWRGLTYGSSGWRAGPDAGDRARESWERVHGLDPLGLDAPTRLMALAVEAGDARAAARWALESLRLDGLKRLDPLKRLSDAERAEAQRIAGEP